MRVCLCRFIISPPSTIVLDFVHCVKMQDLVARTLFTPILIQLKIRKSNILNVLQKDVFIGTIMCITLAWGKLYRHTHVLDGRHLGLTPLLHQASRNEQWPWFLESWSVERKVPLSIAIWFFVCREIRKNRLLLPMLLNQCMAHQKTAKDGEDLRII